MLTWVAYYYVWRGYWDIYRFLYIWKAMHHYTQCLPVTRSICTLLSFCLKLLHTRQIHVFIEDRDSYQQSLLTKSRPGLMNTCIIYILRYSYVAHPETENKKATVRNSNCSVPQAKSLITIWKQYYFQQFAFSDNSKVQSYAICTSKTSNLFFHKYIGCGCVTTSINTFLEILLLWKFPF